MSLPLEAARTVHWSRRTTLMPLGLNLRVDQAAEAEQDRAAGHLFHLACGLIAFKKANTARLTLTQTG